MALSSKSHDDLICPTKLLSVYINLILFMIVIIKLLQDTAAQAKVTCAHFIGEKNVTVATR